MPLAAEHGDALEALCWVAKNDPEPYVSMEAISGLVLLAPTHKDALAALEHVAKNDQNDRLRNEAAAAVQSLTRQATIDPSDLRQLGGLQR